MATEKRLIDANALMQVFYNGEYAVLNGIKDPIKSGITRAALHWCEEKLNNAPTVDAVEVVRGKDCKHSECNPVKLTYACRHPSGLRGFINEGYYFCSYGERKDNDI